MQHKNEKKYLIFFSMYHPDIIFVYNKKKWVLNQCNFKAVDINIFDFNVINSKLQ